MRDAESAQRAQHPGEPGSPDSMKTVDPIDSPAGGRGRLYLLLKRVYSVLPSGLRNAAHPLAKLYGLLNGLRPEVWIVTGEEKGSHLPLSACLYTTTSEHRNYLLELIFGTSFRQRYLGRAWLWNVFRKFPKEARGCSMVFAEVHKSHLKLIGPGGGVVIPVWVSGEVDLPLPEQVMGSKSVRSDLRRIRNNAFECEITRDPKRFDDFYQNMYLPYIRGRHGESALLITREALKAQFDQGDLILVKHRGEFIAGQVITYDGTFPSLRVLAVRDGNQHLVRLGAIGASYVFALQHLEAKGYRKVSFGRSRAFLRDGVLRFKRKWSQAIVSGSAEKFLMKVVTDTAGTRAFLQSNPFISEHLGELRGNIFLAGDRPLTEQTLEEIDKDYSHTGLSKLIIWSLCQDDGSIMPVSAPRLRRYELLPEVDQADLKRRLGCIGTGSALDVTKRSMDFAAEDTASTRQITSGVTRADEIRRT